MTRLTMNIVAPRKGDYVQLLDEDLMPCENFTYVDKWTGELGCKLFLIEDFRGESIAVTRCHELDSVHRTAWQEVATATA